MGRPTHQRRYWPVRKYTPLIGCLKHNPRHSRFPIPNAVWKYKLKPIEFVLLSYFCCQHSHDSTNVSPEMAAKGTHMTAVTVKKYLEVLQKKLCKSRQAIVKETGVNQGVAQTGHSPA